MYNEKTLNDYIPSMLTGAGLFTEIAKVEWFPGLDPAAFDTYMALTAGEKIGRKMLDLYSNDDGVVTGTNLTALAKMIFAVNAISWRNIYRDLTVEYNPIENTDFYETINDKSTGSGTVVNDTDVSYKPGSVATNKRSGLGSETLVNDSSTTMSGTDKTENDSTVTNNNSGTYERELHKHGNIGVTTNAQMINSDLEVWRNKIADLFIKDICDLIALSIY